jgi:NCS1 family nucleobase:cation symporter-1
MVQLIAVPGLFTITALFGAVSANMTMVIPRYGGVATFQPFDVIEKGGWLESHGGRAAAFFCSAAWALGSMTTNISEKSFLVVLLLLADSFCLAYSC